MALLPSLALSEASLNEPLPAAATSSSSSFNGFNSSAGFGNNDLSYMMLQDPSSTTTAATDAAAAAAEFRKRRIPKEKHHCHHHHSNASANANGNIIVPAYPSATATSMPTGVDFTLASTYVPGIMCLMRTSIVIIIMSRYVANWLLHFANLY